MLRRDTILLIAVISPSALYTAAGQTAPNRYTLILDDPPVVERFAATRTMRTQEAANYLAQIRELRHKIPSVSGCPVTRRANPSSSRKGPRIR
jgi:hypothetical protein